MRAEFSRRVAAPVTVSETVLGAALLGSSSLSLAQLEEDEAGFARQLGEIVRM